MHYFIRFHRLPPNEGHRDVTLKDWARENQDLFPNYNFTNSQSRTPITHVIRDFLLTHGFRLFEENGNNILQHEDEELFRNPFH